MTAYKITIATADSEHVYEVTASSERAAFLTAAAEPIERDLIPALMSSEAAPLAVSDLPAEAGALPPEQTPASVLPTDDAHLLGLVW